MKILVIEDNPAIATHLASAFQDNGHLVDKAGSGAEGQMKLTHEAFDAIVLDVMLPDVDGITLCSDLRRKGLKTPILIVTALGATDDKIRALDAGADDYLVKPVHLGEMAARVRALCRRGEPQASAALRYQDLELKLASKTVSRDGREIQLRPKEFALLAFLMRNPQRVLTRAEIGERVWDINFDVESNVIEVYVSILRKKLGEPSLIHTITGVGYRFGFPQ